METTNKEKTKKLLNKQNTGISQINKTNVSINQSIKCKTRDKQRHEAEEITKPISPASPLY